MVAGIIAVGCSQSTTTAPSTSPTPSTAGEFAAAGEHVFVSHCSGCHGAGGQGGSAPAVIGPGAHLAKYNTAQGLLDYIDTTMPANAPGSLSHQEYFDILSYLLVENDDLSSNSQLDETQLGGISLQ